MTDTTQQSEVERVAKIVFNESAAASWTEMIPTAEHIIATLRPKVSEVDLEKASFRSLCEAAGQSNWIPPEYMANDWLADCARFLRTGKGIVQASGAEVWEVMLDLDVMARNLARKDHTHEAINVMHRAADLLARLNPTDSPNGEK